MSERIENGLWIEMGASKEALKKWDINKALSYLGKQTDIVVEAKKEELAGCYELAEFTKNLNQNDDYVAWVDNILSQFLTPQSLTV